MRILRQYLCVPAVLAFGCVSGPSSPLGSLTGISPERIPGKVTVLAKNVQGRHCSEGADYGHAVADAIQQVPGANAIVDADVFVDFRATLFVCTRVVGDAAQLE